MLSITVSNRRQKNETNRALICFFNENTGEYKVIKENVLPDNLTEHLKKLFLKNNCSES